MSKRRSNRKVSQRPFRILRGITIEAYADERIVISTPGRYLGVDLVHEVHREDGSAWHLLASIANDVVEQRPLPDDVEAVGA